MESHEVEILRGLPAWLALCITALGAFISWLLADQKAKVRSAATDRQVEILMARQHEIVDASHHVLVRVTKNEQRLVATAENLLRLEHDKASRDTVAAIQQDLSGLRQQMDMRFDRIERLIKN